MNSPYSDPRMICTAETILDELIGFAHDHSESLHPQFMSYVVACQYLRLDRMVCRHLKTWSAVLGWGRAAVNSSASCFAIATVRLAVLRDATLPPRSFRERTIGRSYLC